MTEELSLEQAKALAYDLIVALQRAQQKLAQVESRIRSLESQCQAKQQTGS